MDKQGALYFKLLTGVFLLVLVGYGLGRICSREPAYELYSTQICEVGDGITVSGFVVRSESLLYSRDVPTFLPLEGQWVGGGQALATTATGSLVASRGGYLSYAPDGYESLLTPEYILHCSEEELLTLSPADLPQQAVGKLIHDQRWYFAAAEQNPLLSEGSPELKIGDTLRLAIGDGTWEATVRRTQDVLVVECTTGIPETLPLRQATGQLLFASRQGIPIPREAIYYENGETYVYLLQGGRARRKAVHIFLLQKDTLWISPEDLPRGAQVILTDTEITDGMVLA